MEQQGFNVINIVLAESNFRRVDTFDIGKEENENATIKTSYEHSGEMLNCAVEVDYKLYSGTVLIMEAKITMVGIFKIINVPQPNIDSFANINAPAIIYPYIREHLSSITSKSGIRTIILTPYNFIEHAKQAALNKVNEKK